MSKSLFGPFPQPGRNEQSQTPDSPASSSKFTFGSKTPASTSTSASTGNMENTPTSTSGSQPEASASQKPATSNPPPSLFGVRQSTATKPQAPIKTGLFRNSTTTASDTPAAFATSSTANSAAPASGTSSATPTTSGATPVSASGTASPAATGTAPAAAGTAPVASDRPKPSATGSTTPSATRTTPPAPKPAPTPQTIPEPSWDSMFGKPAFASTSAGKPLFGSCAFSKPAEPAQGFGFKWTGEKSPVLCPQAQALKLVAPKETIIDQNGDLRLRVGKIMCTPSSIASNHSHTEVMEFLVDSRALVRSSPVFAKMLHGPFAESKKGRKDTKEKGKGKQPEKVEENEDNKQDEEQDHENDDGQWRITFPEDNIVAMDTLLHIMHCRFDKTPPIQQAIGLEDLYHIAVLTDKYDCTTLVRPWVPSWLIVASSFVNDGSIVQLERISWIAWEFGDSALFEKTVQSLVLRHSAATPGLFGSAPSDSLFVSTLEPNGLKELVTQRRQKALGEMLAPIRKASGLLHQPLPKKNDIRRTWVCSVPTTLFQPNEAEKGHCEAAMLGMLIQSLLTVGLFPIPHATTFPDSVFSLKSRLKVLSVKGSCDPKHSECKPIRNLAETLDTVTSGIKSLTTLNQARHLAAQAKKSGIAA